MFLIGAKSERLQPEPIASSLIYSWRCFPTHLTKSFQQLIVRNAPPPSLSCTFWLNYSTFTLPPSITFFDKLQLAANFAGKIFNLALSPSLFSCHEFYISSPGENSETPFPPFLFVSTSSSVSNVQILNFQKLARWRRSSWTMPRQLPRRSVCCSSQVNSSQDLQPTAS